MEQTEQMEQMEQVKQFLYDDKDKDHHYVTKMTTTDTDNYYHVGYKYFTGLTKKRRTPAEYNKKNNLVGYCGYPIDEYEKFSREIQIKLDHGYYSARDKWVSEKVQLLLDELKLVQDKYQIYISLGCGECSDVVIDGEIFWY